MSFATGMNRVLTVLHWIALMLLMLTLVLEWSFLPQEKTMPALLWPAVIVGGFAFMKLQNKLLIGPPLLDFLIVVVGGGAMLTVPLLRRPVEYEYAPVWVFLVVSVAILFLWWLTGWIVKGFLEK